MVNILQLNRVIDYLLHQLFSSKQNSNCKYRHYWYSAEEFIFYECLDIKQFFGIRFILNMFQQTRQTSQAELFENANEHYENFPWSLGWLLVIIASNFCLLRDGLWRLE